MEIKSILTFFIVFIFIFIVGGEVVRLLSKLEKSRIPGTIMMTKVMTMMMTGNMTMIEMMRVKLMTWFQAMVSLRLCNLSFSLSRLYSTWNNTQL